MSAACPPEFRGPGPPTPPANQPRIARFGILLLVLGVAFNKWSLSLLAPDRRIDNGLYIAAILLAQSLLIGSGATILLLRRHPHRLRAMALNATVATTAFLLCFIGLEVVLRVAASVPPYSLHLLSDGPGGRFRLKPRLDVAARVGRTEVRIRTNSLGMRWREPSGAIPARPRIAFVGDSFTFGEWADCIEHSFVGVFDSLVDRRRYEVLNFGVPSYGLLEIEAQIREEVLSLHPRFVLLMFFNGNDIADTFLGSERHLLRDGVAVRNRAKLQDLIPAPFRSDRPEPAGSASTLRGLLDRSRVYKRVEIVYEQRTELRRLETFTPGRAFLSFRFWSQVDDPPIARAAVDWTLGVLDDIWTMCGRNGVRLAVAAIPFKEQVYAREPDGASYSVSRPQSHIARFAAERAIPYLDLTPLLRQQVQTTGERLYVPGDPHFNNNGHRITGVALVEFFRSRVEGPDHS